MESQKKSFEHAAADLALIDLDLLNGISDDDLLGHFEGIARSATEGQLLQVLGLHPGQSAYSHEMLVRQFAGRRHATALKLRQLRGCMYPC